MHPKPIYDHYFLSNVLSNGEELLLQTPKCFSKQGIIMSANKKCIDFVFTSQHEDLFQWILSLEERIQQLIYEKRNLWFMEDTLGMDDIQNSFVSMIKTKGDVHTVRAFLPHASLSTDPILFNDAKLPIEESSIKETTMLIGILHFVGIRFNQQTFQLMVQVKQLMSLSLPTKCLIQPDTKDVQSILDKEEEIKRSQFELEELRRKLKSK
jgi:hypothetical protein